MAKICVVGAGRWGRNHVRTLNELDLLGGVCDADAEGLRKIQEQYPHIDCFNSLDDALGAGMDGFTVATPAHTHFKVASRILKSGFPALVEKPLALSSSDARSLRHIAEANGQQLMVGHLMLFHPAIEKIKSLIDAGQIGKLQYIYSNRINLGTVRTEEDILWSFAPHDISIFQYLIDDNPIEVVSRGGAYLQPGIHDATMTLLKYPNNVQCHNYVSWLHPFKEHRIVVIGSKGMLRFDDSSEDKALLFYEKGIDWVNGEPITRDGPTAKIEYASEQPLARELKYFADNLNGSIAKADARNAIEVLEILERASVQIAGKDSAAADNGTQAPAVGNVSDTAVLGEGAYVHDSAHVDDGVVVGPGTKVWHSSHIQSGATLGANCSLGQNVNVGNNVKIGDGVKVQNNVSVFEGVELEDYVFCGPSMTFTNVLNPRAKYPTGSENYGRTLVKEGASIGAKAVIVCGNMVGRHAMIGAGAVVTSDVPDYALMVGVPARRVGWVTEGGERIPDEHEGEYTCSISGRRYTVENDLLREVS